MAIRLKADMSLDLGHHRPRQPPIDQQFKNSAGDLETDRSFYLRNQHMLPPTSAASISEEKTLGDY